MNRGICEHGGWLYDTDETGLPWEVEVGQESTVVMT